MRSMPSIFKFSLDHQVFRIFHYIPSLSVFFFLYKSFYSWGLFLSILFNRMNVYNHDIGKNSNSVCDVYKIAFWQKISLILLFVFLPFLFIYALCVHTCVNVLWCIYKGQSTTFWSQFSPPTSGPWESNLGCQAWWQVPHPLCHLTGPFIG